jgi:DNA uptake protein ComE-like DNA-binding protein
MRHSQKSFLTPGNNYGSILVFSIWVLVFLAILGVGIYSIVSSQVILVKKLQDRIIGQNLVNAVCVYAASENQKDTSAADSLYELRAEKHIELARGKACYILIDEESKINLNTASSEVITRLIKEVSGLPESSSRELAESLVSARSEKPFGIKEEILGIDGITEKIFSDCADFITVYGEGKVNVNTAAVPVLFALGMDEDLAKKIEAFRAGADMHEATEDDEVFVDTGEIIEKINALGSLSDTQRAMLASLISNSLCCVEAKNFTIRIQTKTLDKTAMQYSVVLDGQGAMREWHEL